MSRSVTKVVAQHRLVTFAGDVLTFDVDWHQLLRTSSAWAEKESKAQKSYTNNARGSLCRWRTTAINKRHVLLYINKILKKEAWLAKCPSSTNYINGWSVEWKKYLSDQIQSFNLALCRQLCRVATTEPTHFRLSS